MDQPVLTNKPVLTSDEKKKLYRKQYYINTKDINKDVKKQKQHESNKKYVASHQEKIKQYRENYYTLKPDKFKIKSHKCELCNYIGTASNVARHRKSSKHKDKEIQKILKS